MNLEELDRLVSVGNFEDALKLLFNDLTNWKFYAAANAQLSYWLELHLNDALLDTGSDLCVFIYARYYEKQEKFKKAMELIDKLLLNEYHMDLTDLPRWLNFCPPLINLAPSHHSNRKYLLVWKSRLLKICHDSAVEVDAWQRATDWIYRTIITDAYVDSQHGSLTLSIRLCSELGLFQRQHIKGKVTCVVSQFLTEEELGRSVVTDDGRASVVISHWSKEDDLLISIHSDTLCALPCVYSRKLTPGAVRRPFGKFIVDERWDAGIPGKIWDAAYILYLVLKRTWEPQKLENTLMIDLSAGSGFLGISLSDYSDLTILTELPEELELLKHNVLINGISTVLVKELRWGNEEQLRDVLNVKRDVDNLIILAADLIYASDYHDELIQTLHGMFRTSTAKVDMWLAYKARAISSSDKQTFVIYLQSLGINVEIIDWKSILNDDHVGHLDVDVAHLNLIG